MQTCQTLVPLTLSPSPRSQRRPAPRASSGSLVPAPRRSCRCRRRRLSGWFTRLTLGEVWRCRLDVRRSASLSLPPAGGVRGYEAREGAGPRGGARGAEGRGLACLSGGGRTRAVPFTVFPPRCFSPAPTAPSNWPRPSGSGRIRVLASRTSAGYTIVKGLETLRNSKGVFKAN